MKREMNGCLLSRKEEGEMERWDKGGNEGTDGGDEGEMN